MKTLYPYRFEIFLISQLAILFGSLVIPSVFFDNTIEPILFILNFLAGFLLVSKKKKLRNVLLLLIVFNFCLSSFKIIIHLSIDIWRMILYFIFYILATSELIRQVWNAEVVDKKVILGLVSGYISLGLISFFICLSIEVLYPNSFSGFLESSSITENLLYYCFITLMTIGYGDILPITPVAQKAAILIGLIGQLYLVVLTAIVVGKYINQSSNGIKSA